MLPRFRIKLLPNFSQDLGFTYDFQRVEGSACDVKEHETVTLVSVNYTAIIDAPLIRKEEVITKRLRKFRNSAAWGRTNTAAVAAPAVLTE
ncbi:hypothetical protein MTO96_033695 [Rhipicephalus appendiculatus]